MLLVLPYRTKPKFNTPWLGLSEFEEFFDLREGHCIDDMLLFEPAFSSGVDARLYVGKIAYRMRIWVNRTLEPFFARLCANNASPCRGA